MDDAAEPVDSLDSGSRVGAMSGTLRNGAHWRRARCGLRVL